MVAKATNDTRTNQLDRTCELIGAWDACCLRQNTAPMLETNRCCATARPNLQLLERARWIQQMVISYIPHADFDRSSVQRELLRPTEQRAKGKVPASPPRGLPPYVADLYRTPLLEREEEAYLFRRMNGLKHLARQLQSQIDPLSPVEGDMQQFEHLVADAEQIRNRIVEANLRLVFSLAKRFAGADSDEFNECVAEGNFALMRAVDLFDYSRGNRFSTYAHHAIRRQLLQRIQAESRRRERFVSGGEEAAAELDRDEGRAIRDDERVQVAQLAVRDLMPCLTDRERAVIEVRFGLGDHQKPQTYEEIGRRMGVSKERVRQLQMRALQKMARSAADSSAVVAWEEAV